jgi:acylglycerol lipase
VPELQGTKILYRKWDAAPSPASPKAVFILIHGLGAHSARWEFLAGNFGSRGYVSYAIELGGFGRTPDRPRGHIASFRIWDRDILELREIIARDHPGIKVFLLGESLGSLIAFNLAGRYPGQFSGQALISPSFKNAMKFPLSAYVKLVLFWFFKPTMMIDVPFNSEMLTRDPEYLPVMNANPDELRIASLRLLGGVLPEQARARRLAGKLAVPTLFLIPGIDHLVDERASRKIFKKIAIADNTIIEYPDMLHALSLDIGREKVFRDILDWAEQRL